MRRRAALHLVALACSMIGAAGLVHLDNTGYWSGRPFPGDKTAREMLPERPGLELEIARLVRVWSVPLGAVAFFALHGAAASVLEVRGGVRYALAATFACPIFEFHIAWFVLPPCFGTLAACWIAIFSACRRNRRAFWFSMAALALNVISAVMSWFYITDYFDVFGD